MVVVVDGQVVAYLATEKIGQPQLVETSGLRLRSLSSLKEESLEQTWKVRGLSQLAIDF